MKSLPQLLAPRERTFCSIDFGNVNRWFVRDGLEIDLAGLAACASSLAARTNFYYGHDAQKPGSLAFLSQTRLHFGRSRVITKPIQKIATASGQPILKANFDVEIAVDAMRLMEHYDAFVLLSGDADFAYLLKRLREAGKKTILIRKGYIAYALRDAADLVLDAADFAESITRPPR